MRLLYCASMAAMASERTLDSLDLDGRSIPQRDPVQRSIDPLEHRPRLVALPGDAQEQVSLLRIPDLHALVVCTKTLDDGLVELHPDWHVCSSR